MGRLTLFLMLCCSAARAATITAASVAQNDVQTAYNLCTNSDTLEIPAGSATWTTNITFALANFTVKGAGTNLTVITDEVSRSGSPVALITILAQLNSSFRLTGVSVRGGVTNTASNFNGVIRCFGSTAQFRIDYCDFFSVRGPNIVINGYLRGVMDHCQFITGSQQAAQIYHDQWLGGDWGNGSWAADPGWGTDQFFFIEDCVLRETVPETGGVDVYKGGRVVLRHNVSTNCIFTHHGTEGNGRGAFASEVYSNWWTMTTPKSWGQLRSGSSLIHDNILINYTTAFNLLPYRQFQQSASWGKSDGTSLYDTNVAGGPFFVGVHTGTNGATRLENTNANFNINLHFGYILSNTNTGRYGYIISNTTTNITYVLDNGEAGNQPFMTWTNGDHYSISAVIRSLDQPSEGQGDLKSGFPFTPAVWPNTVLEPCYGWNNTNNGSLLSATFASSVGTIFSGTNFFNNVQKPGYTPFTYPHPLTMVTNVPSAPNAPRRFRRTL